MIYPFPHNQITPHPSHSSPQTPPIASTLSFIGFHILKLNIPIPPHSPKLPLFPLSPLSPTMEYKQASKQLAKYWKVEKKHETCYSGGKVEYMAKTNSLACLCNGNVAFLDLKTGEVSSVLVPEDAVGFELPFVTASPNTSRRSHVSRFTPTGRRLSPVVATSFCACGTSRVKRWRRRGAHTTPLLPVWRLILQASCF